jgi:hypothetical protein
MKQRQAAGECRSVNAVRHFLFGACKRQGLLSTCLAMFENTFHFLAHQLHAPGCNWLARLYRSSESKNYCNGPRQQVFIIGNCPIGS